MRLKCIFCHFQKCFCTCPCVPNSHLAPQHDIARNAGDLCRISRQSQLGVRGDTYLLNPNNSFKSVLI
jgi:hypothetical protein